MVTITPRKMFGMNCGQTLFVTPLIVLVIGLYSDHVPQKATSSRMRGKKTSRTSWSKVWLHSKEFLSCTLPEITKKIQVPAKRHYSNVVRHATKQPGAMIRRETFYAYRGSRTGTRQVQRHFHLGNKKNVQASKKIVNGEGNNLLHSFAKPEGNQPPIGTVVIYEPGEGDLDCLPQFRDECPDVDVVIFHRPCEKWGVEVSGDPDNWEDEFPAMGEVDIPQLEIIVDDLIVKGSIHVFAGRFETYKTMFLIELCSSILDGRPVSNQFKVLHRYPVLFLEEDMSPEQFYDYAAPFNLMKHGEDIRVKHPRGIMHAIDSPVLQKAVNGRILILDTMLDFAQIEKAAESGEWVKFMQRLRELMTVHGCVAVIMTAHSTKTGAKSTDIDPSEYFKDSATFGGKVDIGYGHKALPDSSQIEIKRIKQRGFKKALNFTIAVYDDDGESNLSKGTFPVYQKPGEFKKGKGRPAKRDPETVKQIKACKAAGKSNRDIAEEVGLSEPTIRRILDEDQKQTFDFSEENKQ